MAELSRRELRKRLILRCRSTELDDCVPPTLTAHSHSRAPREHLTSVDTAESQKHNVADALPSSPQPPVVLAFRVADARDVMPRHQVREHHANQRDRFSSARAWQWWRGVASQPVAPYHLSPQVRFAGCTAPGAAPIGDDLLSNSEGLSNLLRGPFLMGIAPDAVAPTLDAFAERLEALVRVHGQRLKDRSEE